MVPYKDGGANEGHSLRQGPLRLRLRHPHGPACSRRWCASTIDRPVARGRPGTRRSATPPGGSSAIQAEYGVGSIGGITSSRCTNEEVYVVQKMVRAAFGNNNVDTCARVCHSPTGYGLKQTFGTSAGTQDFDSVDEADVILVIGANPTDAHPVFASRMKQRLREGAQLIVVDPRRIDLVRTPARRGRTTTCRCSPAPTSPSSTRWPTSSSPRAWSTEAFVARALRADDFDALGDVHRRPGATRPEAIEPITGVPAADAARRRPALRRPAATRAIYYGLGVTEHSQGSTMVMGMANLAMATGNIGRDGRRRQPAARPEQRAGLLRHGLVPARAPRLPPRLRRRGARASTRSCGARRSSPSRACASPTCSTRRSTAPSRACTSRARTSPSPTPTPSTSTAALRGDGLRRRAGPVPQRDGQRSPTSSCPAPRSWRRTAPSPTPSAGSTGSAR